MYFPDKDKINELKSLLSVPKNIAVLMHPNPDGDTIGASLAWSRILRKMGHTVMPVSVDVLPYDLHWLPEINQVMLYDRKAPKIDEFLQAADLVFSIDFNTPKRLNQLENSLRNSPAKQILIDHHLMPDTDFYHLLFSEVEMSSTSELLFVLIKSLDYKEFIDQDVASLIFVGIMTDTGSFSYSCNSPETFEHTAELIRFGLNVKAIHDRVYNDNPEDRLRLLGYSINNKLAVNKEKKSAYISLTQNELRQFNEKPGFTEGLVNMALSVEGVLFAALLIEKNKYIKLSFRSKGELDVNRIAREFFNGGGHKNASGGKLFMDMDKSLKLLEDVIQNHIPELI